MEVIVLSAAENKVAEQLIKGLFFSFIKGLLDYTNTANQMIRKMKHLTSSVRKSPYPTYLKSKVLSDFKTHRYEASVPSHFNVLFITLSKESILCSIVWEVGGSDCTFCCKEQCSRTTNEGVIFFIIKGL